MFVVLLTLRHAPFLVDATRDLPMTLSIPRTRPSEQMILESATQKPFPPSRDNRNGIQAFLGNGALAVLLPPTILAECFTAALAQVYAVRMKRMFCRGMETKDLHGNFVLRFSSRAFSRISAPSVHRMVACFCRTFLES